MMTRYGFRSLLTNLDLSGSPQEAPFRERMLALADSTPDCFQRSCFPAHFTGSALVLSHDRRLALLNHHRNLKRWLQFGGHCDGDEDILRVARREALEESGIEELLPLSPRPFDLDIHDIPANPQKGEPAHAHFDIRFFLIAPPGSHFTVSEESLELRWFTLDEMLALPASSGLERLAQKWKNLPSSLLQENANLPTHTGC